MEDFKELFSKHFNRIKTDLNQINGVTPLMIMAISNNFRNLEKDILEKLENEYESEE